MSDCIELLGIDVRDVETLPFYPGDTTAGAENELQVSVSGDRTRVDLPLAIEASSYYAHVRRRSARGDMPRKTRHDLENYLQTNSESVWENSWVRFPVRCLGTLARSVLERDLLADKRSPEQGKRTDVDRFFVRWLGEDCVRVPISYVLKLALADAASAEPTADEAVRQRGLSLMGHFLNDNSSPETHSFHVVQLNPLRRNGVELARETARRFLLTQLLVEYANENFELRRRGQTAEIYFSPHPPVRQKQLNACLSDNFYRELFMSPCLNGWDRGEEKFEYMQLCHRVISRSHLSAMAKLRECGVISNNLVVMPHTSNVSLANNGTHISFGSRRLTDVVRANATGREAAAEKCVGDLVIKLSEHFLPLFTGRYTADPYRVDFDEFHPESVLGFLPHELDYKHLRMLWWRWKHKASNGVAGRPMTPFGPVALDRALGAVFRLKGDLVPDFRLIDYLTCLMSTEDHAALDGVEGNDGRLKRALHDMGVFDSRMSFYQFVKMRRVGGIGFSGFESRYFSLFESFGGDLATATDLQLLIFAYLTRTVAEGRYSHEHVPDTPLVESERRQIFFSSAIGLRSFYVRNGSRNQFLQDVLQRCRRVRRSARYPGYLKVYIDDYLAALIELLQTAAAREVEALQVSESLADLERRVRDPRRATSARLTRAISDRVGAKPMSVRARTFNEAAERYYRTDLRLRHIDEALIWLQRDVAEVARHGDSRLAQTIEAQTGGDAVAFIARVRRNVRRGRPSVAALRRLIHVVLAVECFDAERHRVTSDERKQ